MSDSEMVERPANPYGYILLTYAEYRRLLIAAEGDDMLLTCEICGAWIDRNDPACADIISGYRGCWKGATGRMQDSHLCRSWRAPDREPVSADMEAGADLVMPAALAPNPPAEGRDTGENA